MDRHRTALARGAAAAAVSAFLVAGGAFAANGVLAPAPPERAPASTFATDDPALVATEARDVAGEPAETAEPAQTAGPAKTPEVDNDPSGGHEGRPKATSEATSSPEDNGRNTGASGGEGENSHEGGKSHEGGNDGVGGGGHGVGGGGGND